MLILAPISLFSHVGSFFNIIFLEIIPTDIVDLLKKSATFVDEQHTISKQ